MHAIGVAIWIGAALAWIYGAYHYWVFYDKFERGRMAGKIPSGLQRPRMGIAWLIASAGVVPEGELHRRKFMRAFALFVGLLIAFALLTGLQQAGVSL